MTTRRFDRPGLLGSITPIAVIGGVPKVITNVVRHPDPPAGQEPPRSGRRAHDPVEPTDRRPAAGQEDG